MYKSLAHNYQIENLETVFVKIFSKTKQILSAQYVGTLRWTGSTTTSVLTLMPWLYYLF